MTDQFEPAYRTLVVACKSDKRWFDLDAVRSPHKYPETMTPEGARPATQNIGAPGHHTDPKDKADGMMGNPAGAPPLDYWLLDTQAGVDRVLKSMLPERVCKICGEPSRRIVELAPGMGGYHQGNGGGSDTAGFGRTVRDSTTLGWTDCGHNDWRAGVVLDPFDLTSERTEVGQARYIIGDVLDVLATLPDDSVDFVMSSPPFLALRSYLPADHINKSKEIGSEATPADFLDTLLDVVEACDRVLAPHGSLCFELGDTFAGSGGAGGDYAEKHTCPKCGGTGMNPERSGWLCLTCKGAKSIGGLRSGQPKFRQGTPRWDGRPEGQIRTTTSDPVSYPSRGLGEWPLPKSLCGIPTLFAWSLAYGRNLLRPERTTPRWRIRNVVVWARPNPPVGALGDKFRPATSYLTVACKSDKRWFDLDSVREPSTDTRPWNQSGPKFEQPTDSYKATDDGYEHDRVRVNNPAGAPPLDYWEIPTHPFPGSHYATFPPALCIKPIKSMTPKRVCRVCGEPSRRIVGETRYESTNGGRVVLNMQEGERLAENVNQWKGEGGRPGHFVKVNDTLGWTDCGHDDYRAGVTLDPFAGSGTTLSVATGHGRDAIGIDLDSRNAELALERVGPLFLTIETLEDTKPFTPPAEDVETEIV